MRERPWALIFLSAALVLYSWVTAASHLEGWPYIGLNLIVALLMLGWARRNGLSATDVGFSRESVGPGLLAGGISLGIFLIGLAIAMSLDDTSAITSGSSAGCGEDISSVSELRFEVLRVVLGTAFAEEVMFRGVLLAYWTKRWGPGCSATMATTLPFALWHVVPTMVNEGPCSLYLLGTVAVAVIGTFVAGIILAWLRRRTRGILGPVLVHSLVNGGLITASYVLAS